MTELKKDRKYHYFVDGAKYDTHQSSITGSEIKAAIPNFNPGYSLYLVGHGQDPDKLVADSDSFNLEHGSKRFHTVPPASFGEK
jgi:hypothetical protein